MQFHYVKNSAGEFLCGLDQDNNPIYSSQYDQALWSWNWSRINAYVSDNSISDAELQSDDSGGNNPPNKPPF